MPYADASIYSLLKPQQPLPNPIEQYGQGLQLKNLIRSDRETEASNAAWSASGGNMDKFFQNLATQGGSYKAALAAQKAGLETTKTRGDIAKTQQETILKAFDTSSRLTERVESPEQAALLVQSDYNDPILGGILKGIAPLDQALARIPQTPAELQQWKEKRVLGLKEQINNQIAIRAQNQPTWDPERGVWVPKPGTGGMGGGPGPRPDKPTYDAVRGMFVNPSPRAAGRMGMPLAASSAIPVPGLPKTPKQIKEAKEQEREISVINRATDAILSNIDQLIGSEDKKIPEHPGLAGSVGYIDAHKLVPPFSSDQSDAQALIAGLLSKSSVEGLQTVRGSGTAPGSITEKEWPIFQNYLATINPQQQLPMFKKQLQDYRASVKKYRQDVLNSIKNNPNPEIRVPAYGGAQPIVPNPATAPPPPPKSPTATADEIDAELRRRGVIR